MGISMVFQSVSKALRHMYIKCVESYIILRHKLKVFGDILIILRDISIVFLETYQ